MPESRLPKLEGAPYFNFETRHLSIEGSPRITPTKPVEVGHERQLLMDQHLVDSTWNCFRRVHQPKKHPANPLIPGGESTADGARTPANVGTVMYDQDLGRFRFWTTLSDSTRPKFDASRVQVYWESEDGIEWTAPELGLVEFEGSRANNVIRAAMGYIYGSASVVEVP